MELLLQRDIKTARSTCGQLFVDGVFNCYTLEDAEREVKEPGETCIPVGRYRVIITRSLRFGKLLPLLCDVPNFTGIRIHGGNFASDTRGCILVGQLRLPDQLLHSQLALIPLQEKIHEALDSGKEVWITIENKVA